MNRVLSSGLSAVILISVFSVSSKAKTELPPLAKSQLEKIGGSLSVDFVLAQAMKGSDSFKSVIADKYSLKKMELASQAGLTTTLTASGGSTTDETDNDFNITGSNTDKTTARSYALGLSKRFITGTSASVELTQDFVRTEGAEINTAFADLDFNSEGYESRLAVNLSQSLVKDSFGTATRNRVKSGELSAKASEEELIDNTETWAIDLVTLFYSAWSLQNQVRVFSDNLQRKKRLVDITKVKLRRGTAEKPDLLQAESAVLEMQIQLEQAQQQLEAFWRDLITQLGLPLNWININPTIIPLSLDRPYVDGLELCGGESGKIAEPPKSDSRTRRWGYLKEAASLSESAAKNSMLPDLSLVGQYFFNGIDAESGNDSFQELTEWDNEGYYLGFAFTFPLERYKEKSELVDSMATKVKAEALESFYRSSLVTNWANECNDLRRLGRALDQRKEALNKQNERVKLEERRYSLGRSNLLQVIQAGDEASQADFNVINSRIDFRRKGWAIKKLSGVVKPELEMLEKRFRGLKL